MAIAVLSLPAQTADPNAPGDFFIISSVDLSKGRFC
jgi:hypothetical protein